MLGCLPAARHTLNKTLYSKWISDPNKGVTLQPLADVRTIAPADGGYQVTYRDYAADGDQKTVTAKRVFIGAGTLGTNEILLRSREEGGLEVGAELGQRFSTNGNFAGFCVGTAHPVQPTRGPINTCHVDFHVDGRQIVIEDGGIPSMFASIAGTAVRLLDSWGKRELFKGLMHAAWITKTLPDLRSFLPHVPDTYKPDDARTEMEMVSDVFFFNCMAQDDANGAFELKHDKLELKWDDPAGKQPVFGEIEKLLNEFSKAMAGEDGHYVPMPLWHGLADKKLTITHPLGGCRIGPDKSQGVVNEVGAVYDGRDGAGPTDTWPGLFIVDASVIPGAIVAHPTLTIIAQALKTVRAATDGN